MRGTYYPRRRQPLAQRFWAKVDTSGKCWLWTSNTDSHGYGQIAMPGPPPRVPSPAHRVSWELHNGPIPEGMNVLHRCDNPPCVRPEHLFLGTRADNMADKMAKGRYGNPLHHRGSAHPAAILNEDAVRTIRALFANGTRQIDLAAQYGMSPQQIFAIVRRKSWTHI